MSKEVLHINGLLLEEAAVYATKRGVDLSSVVENFFSGWISDDSVEDKISRFHISEEVKSVTRHAGNPAVSIDPEEEKDRYFSEKYGL